MDNSRPADAPGQAPDDLFGKLDHLLNRQEAAIAQPARVDAVPMLTEAIEPSQPAAGSDVPVLLDAVEAQTPRAGAAPVPVDQQRLLQAALYLRLRQRIDEAMQEETLAEIPAEQRARLATSLRRSLPRIVRESVEHAFGSGAPNPE